MPEIKIFKASQIPYKDYQGDLFYRNFPNWAVIIDGQWYYGFRSEADAERAVKPQPRKSDLGLMYDRGLSVPLKVKNNEWWKN